MSNYFNMVYMQTIAHIIKKPLFSDVFFFRNEYKCLHELYTIEMWIIAIAYFNFTEKRFVFLLANLVRYLDQLYLNISHMTMKVSLHHYRLMFCWLFQQKKNKCFIDLEFYHKISSNCALSANTCCLNLCKC